MVSRNAQLQTPGGDSIFANDIRSNGESSLEGSQTVRNRDTTQNRLKKQRTHFLEDWELKLEVPSYFNNNR